MTALRILLVEDDALLAAMFAEVLVGMGHEVCAIESVESEAVAAAARCRPDLMIVDAGLSNGSGVSAVDEILRDGFIPHVFASGSASRIRALRPDAVVLEKPFDEADLAPAIERAMRARTRRGR